LVLEHPALYRIAFQRIVPGFRAGPEVTEARERAFAGLLAKIQRVEDAGLLGPTKSVRQAAMEFNAMLEGLANAELRGATLRILPAGSEERAWRDALGTVVRGLSATAPLGGACGRDQAEVRPGSRAGLSPRMGKPVDDVERDDHGHA
jgi:hypothetical protein